MRQIPASDQLLSKDASPAKDHGDVVALKFGQGVSRTVRARMLYAFRVYAAVYAHHVVEENSVPKAKCFVYGGRADSGCDWRNGDIQIPALYAARPPFTAPRPTHHVYAGEDCYLFYGIDPITGCPDWLGEIFEWISCGYEKKATLRDSVGRIPYSESVFGREGISPRRPYAAMVMAWLENMLRTQGRTQALPKAPSPLPGVEHIVVCCHDVDFYYVNWSSTLIRLIKNLGISWHLYRSPTFFSSNLRLLLQLMRGRRVGDYLRPLAESSGQYHFRSTIFLIARKVHRRDANYRLEDLTSQIPVVLDAGFEVELHGSYESVIERQDLDEDISKLQRWTGRRPAGNRQHWLRFDQHHKLYDTIERAGLTFDSSLGFAERIGFRCGANFAFPPYDFEKEAPYDFLEIPLALMDGSLEATVRATGENPTAAAAEVLSESRKWGWGGMAALWHNPVEAFQVPPEVNDAFWDSVRTQGKFKEVWVNASQFLSWVLGRYRDAGLLNRTQTDG